MGVAVVQCEMREGAAISGPKSLFRRPVGSVLCCARGAVAIRVASSYSAIAVTSCAYIGRQAQLHSRFFGGGWYQPPSRRDLFKVCSRQQLFQYPCYYFLCIQSRAMAFTFFQRVRPLLATAQVPTSCAALDLCGLCTMLYILLNEERWPYATTERECSKEGKRTT